MDRSILTAKCFVMTPAPNLSQAIPVFADTSNNRKTTSNIKQDAPMKLSNSERQRKWKQKQVSNGMRTVTVMLPAEIKDLIDQKRKETGATFAQIIETAVVNLLAAPEETSQNIMNIQSNQIVKGFTTGKLHQIGAELKAITQRFEKLAESKSAVSGNKKPVTNNDSIETEPENSRTQEIYRLVRLLNNMEVSTDEIVFTLNKRKFKTLSGNSEWQLEDVHEVIKNIHQKYGHINPLFSITGTP
jgi:hypothetical protein